MEKKDPLFVETRKYSLHQYSRLLSIQYVQTRSIRHSFVCKSWRKKGCQGAEITCKVDFFVASSSWLQLHTSIRCLLDWKICFQFDQIILQYYIESSVSCWDVNGKYILFCMYFFDSKTSHFREDQSFAFSSYLIVFSVSESFYEQEKVYYWKNEKTTKSTKKEKRVCTTTTLHRAIFKREIGGEKSSDNSC